MMRRVTFAAALALTACHTANDSPTAVTPDQDRQLNDAAAALDANDSAAKPPGDAR